MSDPTPPELHSDDDAKGAGSQSPRRPSRAESPVWQRIESLGQTYLRLSRRLAHLVAATTTPRKP